MRPTTSHHERLTKAYRGLTADQLAGLAFHYISDANALEFERIASSVPLKEYRCPDVLYQARLDRLTRFAGYWGVEHWRMRCRKAELLGAALASVRKSLDEQADELLEAHERAEIGLLSWDAALTKVCDVHGIKPHDVRKFSAAERFVPRLEKMQADEAMVEAMRAELVKLLEK